MTKTFKLDFDDFLEDDFELLAIHTTLESYRLAYFMNIAFDVQFKKAAVIQDFDFYEYDDDKNQSNKIKPIIGCELNICENHNDKTHRDDGYQTVFLAKNKTGYQNLI